MYENLISREFFKENPIKEMSASQILYTRIEVPGMDEYISKILNDGNNDSENEKIRNEKDTSQIMKMMRGKCEINNYGALYDRVLELEDVLFPQIFEMLKTSCNDVFIENAIRVILKSKNDYSSKLAEIIDQAKSPYAASLCCLAYGFIGSEEGIPKVYDKYLEFKKYYFDEDFEQGPLFGLIKFRDRFYEN